MADDEEVRRRQNHGLTRLTRQTKELLLHPGGGGPRGYPCWVRDIEIVRAQAGLEPMVASQRSIDRWTQRFEPYRMTGNRSQGKLVGVDLLLLSIFITVHPSATSDQMATFIYNESGAIYSRVDISRRLKKMKITRKRASTEAYEAFTSQNIWRCDTFCSQAPPLGVVTIPRRQ